MSSFQYSINQETGTPALRGTGLCQGKTPAGYAPLKRECAPGWERIPELTMKVIESGCGWVRLPAHPLSAILLRHPYPPCCAELPQ